MTDIDWYFRASFSCHISRVEAGSNEESVTTPVDKAMNIVQRTKYITIFYSVAMNQMSVNESRFQRAGIG